MLQEADQRVGIFAFGSGCCAEFYSGIASDETGDIARAADLDVSLDGRHQLTLAEYEAAECTRRSYIDEATYRVGLDGFDAWFDRHYRGNGYLFFQGAEDYERQYAWS